MAKKIVLELENEPIEGDILVFHNGKFKCTSTVSFLKSLSDRVEILENLPDRLSTLEDRVSILEGVE